MSIIKLKPAFKDYLWGGTKLKERFFKKTNLDPVAESWELSTHPDGQSTVVGGKYDGYSFGEYLANEGKVALGTNGGKFEHFPILIKFIDAKQTLSVQVHPDDAYALKAHSEYGKTEMWYIVDCDDDAFLYYGVREEITKEQFSQALADGKICDYLNKVSVAKGDVFFIPAGTIHAIGAGIVICEIQQNSNTTYRVYDFGRVGADGRPRELHIDHAINVSLLVPSKRSGRGTQVLQTIEKGVRKSDLARCEYFTATSFDVEEAFTFFVGEQSFVSVIFLEGEGAISSGDCSHDFKMGDSFFISANSGQICIEGTCKYIESKI